MSQPLSTQPSEPGRVRPVTEPEIPPERRWTDPATAPSMPQLDPGIRRYVELLRLHGVETYESCQGGESHAYAEPTVRFYGQVGEGFRAVAVALTYRMPVHQVRRSWSVIENELDGPYWELTFWRRADEVKLA